MGADPTWQSFALGHENPVEQDRAIQAFLRVLKDVTSDPLLREQDGTSQMRLLVRADGRARWQWVQWAMQAAAHPDVKIRRISFSVSRIEADASFGRIDVELPKDRGLNEPQAETRKIKLKVFRRNHDDAERAYTIVKVDRSHQLKLLPGWRGRAHETPGRRAQYEVLVNTILTAVKEKAAGLGGEIHGEIVAPPPKGGLVPYVDVMHALSVLRRAGIENVHFEGAAFPLTSAERAAVRRR